MQAQVLTSSFLHRRPPQILIFSALKRITYISYSNPYIQHHILCIQENGSLKPYLLVNILSLASVLSNNLQGVFLFVCFGVFFCFCLVVFFLKVFIFCYEQEPCSA